jgi:heme exporter protein C
MKDKIFPAIGVLAGIFLVRNLYVILLNLPDEAAQGAIYRILFYHVPSWFTCFTAFFLAAVSSAVYLARRDLRADALAVAVTETGIVFCAVGLVTGMIWARIIWGIWWTWDPRLTWAFITFVVYSGYLMLRGTVDEPGERARLAGALSIFAFVSVIITYKAIDWWRTQHPGAVLSFRTGGGTMDPAMERMFYQNWLALAMLAAVFAAVRYKQERQQRELDALRRQIHAG